MMGTSTSTPTTAARAAPDERLKRLMQTAAESLQAASPVPQGRCIFAAEGALPPFGQSTAGTPNRRADRTGEGALERIALSIPHRSGGSRSGGARPPAGTPFYEPTYRYSSLRISPSEAT